ncbi:MAG: protein kinase domain-containing protein [Solirubrobacteraceae bacterium]
MPRMHSSRAPTTRAPTARPPIARTRADSTRSRGRPGPIVLDRYQLQSRLGTGAFGTVWLARDERLDRDVAVKILARERIVGGRFEREARAAARLSHPAIVTLYEAAVDDDGAYLVSELVHGQTLDELLADGLLSDRDVLEIGIALCDGLAHAHAQGVVHRDVKPSNILVADTRASEPRVAKLTDFGIAALAGADSLTRTGDVIGTLAYMSPEQAEGLEAGPAADLYSFALVLYESLAGVNPLAAGAATQRSRRLQLRMPPLRRQRRDLPESLGRAIDRALRPRPRERGELSDLRAALAATRNRVGDEPGVVEAPLTTLLRRPPTEAEEDAWTAAQAAVQAPAPARGPAPGPAPAMRSDAPTYAWPARGAAGVAAGATAAWLASTALAHGPTPVPAAAAGVLAAAAVLALPRLGWAALACAVCVAAVAAGHSGAAAVLVLALAAPVVILPARPTLWAAPAAAVALGLTGVAGLAGAWPALAARAGTAWRRAALGALGWLWLALGGAIAGRGLYLSRVPGTALPGAWLGVPADALHHVLVPLVSTGALAPAAVWAVGAVLLPWLVRGRSLALDIVRVTMWAAALVSGTGAAISAVHGATAAGAPPGAAIGAVVAGAVALAPHAVARWRLALHPSGAGSRLA